MDRASASRLGHSRQRATCLSRILARARMHQLRVGRYVERHRLHLKRSSHLLLHYIDWMRALEALARRAIAPSTLEPRQVWRHRQRPSSCLFSRFLHLLILPYSAKPFGYGHELGGAYVWRDGYHRHGQLFRQRTEELYRACFAC